MFADAVHLISSLNMTTILELNISRKFWMLQFLFLLILFDYKKDHFNIKLLNIKLKYKNHSYVQIKRTINLNVQKKILTYHTRRNEFLAQVSDEQYCKIFKMLSKHSNIFCSTWHQWLTLNHNMTKSLQKIMKHIMFWYSRNWKYSTSHDNDLKTFNWSTKIEWILFKKYILFSNMKQL